MDVLFYLVTFIGAILNTILFFKLWRMTNNVAEILCEIRRYDKARHPSTSNKGDSNSAITFDGPFTKGQVVVNLKNEDQLRITDINLDGSYSCVKSGTNTYVGDFKEDEIADFDSYWSVKKG